LNEVKSGIGHLSRMIVPGFRYAQSGLLAALPIASDAATDQHKSYRKLKLTERIHSSFAASYAEYQIWYTDAPLGLQSLRHER
jgi:hypothetical protein